MRVPARLFLPCSVFLLSLTLFATVCVTAQDFLSAKLISPSELPVGAGILASGDLNGDGISDVIYSIPPVSVPGSTSMGVALGSTTGLHPAGVYSIAPRSVVVADVNGDGKPDIVGGLNVGPTAEVVVYLNHGDGTFAPPLSSQIVTNNSVWPSVSIGVGDFNGDGKLDVIATDQNGNFFYLRGNGDGTFVMLSQFLQRGIDAYRVAEVVDLNGDGKLDLVVSQLYGATVDVLLGNGDGTFQPLISLPVYTYWPVVADFNGDGIPDIATTTLQADSTGNYTHLVEIFAGNGDGTFRQLNSFSYGSVWGTMLSAYDINGDGKPDLILDTANGFTVCLALGHGQFSAPITYSVPRWGGGGAAVGDFNADGFLDIVGAVNYSNSEVYLLKGFGDGSFEGAPVLDMSGPPTSIAAADVNGDHFLDIVAITPMTTVFLSQPDGTFTSKSDSLTGLGDQVLVADLDGDSIPDELFVTSGPAAGNIAFRHGNGDGTFAQPVAGPALMASGAILADLNRDGKPDLLGITNGSLAVRLGNEDGTFGTEADYSIPSSNMGPRIVVADVNGDGVNDVLVKATSSGSSPNSYVSILIGKGDGAGTLNPPVGSYPAIDFAVADANGDGKPDLIAISADPTQIGLQVYPGDGTGSFGAPTFFATTQSYQTVMTADLNLDGNPDFVLTVSNQIAVMYGNGQGGFGLEDILLASDVPRSIAVGDWNHDGMPDLAIGNSTSGTPSSQSISLLLNRAGYRSSLSFSENPAQYGEPLSASFSVTPTVRGSQPADGSVTLHLDGTETFQGAIVNQQPYSVDLGVLSVGTHSMSGFYYGDGYFRQTNISPVPLTVTQATTSTTLTAPAATIAIGTDVNITVNVQPAFSGLPTGSVTLWDGSAQVASLTLDSNHMKTVLLHSLTFGDHSFTAKYQGDGNFLSGTSVALTEHVRYPTSVMLTSSISTTISGAPITLSVNVTSPSGTPTGSVSFYDGSNLLGQAILANGTASLTSSAVPAGTHSLKASYLGDSSFIANDSSAISETVSDFSLSAAKVSMSVSPGSSATSTLTISPLYGFTGSVTFSCTGAPALGTCSVSPSSVQVTGTPVTATLTATTTGSIQLAQLHHPQSHHRMPLGAALIALGFVSVCGSLRKTPRIALLLCVGLIGICTLPGCGGGGSSASTSTTSTSPATPAGTSTLQIIATTTADGVTLAHQISVSLTVK